MHSMLNPNRSDPHDVFVDAPDVVPTAYAESAHYPHDATLRPSDPQAYVESEFSTVPPIPPVDTTFRATDVNNVNGRRIRPSMGVRAIRGVIGFLLAVCIGVAGALWQSHGDVATAMIAKWVPQLVPASSSPESPALAEQPSSSADQASAAATTAPPQPATAAQAAPDSTASTAAAAVPASDSGQLQAMAQDLAAARQEIEQLKASVAQLKAGQDQMSRDVAKASEVRTPEQTPRPRALAPPPRPLAVPSPRPVAAPVRRPAPAPLLRPSQASVAPVYPQAAAPPPVPRQVEPQPLAPAPPLAPAQPQAEPQVSSVLRPPMPVP
jgi:hypothetical protein